MKLAVYFNSMAPAGGIERVIAKHIGFLVDQHEVTLFTKDDGTSFYTLPDKIKKVSLGVDMTLDMNSRPKRILQIVTTIFKTITKLKKKITAYRPDAIYVATPLCLIEVFLAQLSCKNFIVSEHASYSHYNYLYKLILRFIYKRVAILIVPTSDDSQFYSSIGISNYYLPNPLSFYPKTPSMLQNKVVLNIGRFTDDKRHELLIDLWSRTKGKDHGWKLKIIGQGENYEKLKELIYTLKLESSITLLPPTKEIELAYISASVFALTSRSEGFGLVLAEAMACGVPCVAFNCPSGPKDIITDNRTGYLINDGDLQAFLNHLDELMENEVLRKTLGDQARIDIKKFEESIICEKLNSLIKTHFIKLNG